MNSISETSYDAVVFGAHPDDSEIGLGGTIHKLTTEFSYKILLVDLTNGEPTPNTSSPEIRENEAYAAAKILGADRIIMNLSNRKLFDTFENRLNVASILRKFKPKIVFSLIGRDSDDSPDHQSARILVDAGIFYSKLTKWEKYFEPDSKPWKINNSAYYFLRPPKNLENSVIIDISNNYTSKIKSLNCYQSQFPTDQPKGKRFYKRLKVKNQYLGSLINCDYGELLHLNNKTIKITNPIEFILKN